MGFLVKNATPARVTYYDCYYYYRRCFHLIIDMR